VVVEMEEEPRRKRLDVGFDRAIHWHGKKDQKTR
jgi:hypothetical protein